MTSGYNRGHGGEKKSPRETCVSRGSPRECRRRPTLPRSLDRSTIGAAGLNDRVRDGNGCGPCAPAASDSIFFVLQNWQVSDRVVSGHESTGLSYSKRLLCLVRLTTGGSQAARAIRTAALGMACAMSTGGLST